MTIEEKGVAAIIYLQKMAGIDEPREQALKGWRAMSKHDQDFTVKFYKKMKGPTTNDSRRKTARSRS
jgi:hypothetical protein